MTTVARRKRGDTLPALVCRFTYEDPTLTLDIPVANTCLFTMTREGATVATIAKQAAVITSSVGGVVTVAYTWSATDLSVVGRYRGEFEFHIGADILTGPTRWALTIVIEDDLD